MVMGGMCGGRVKGRGVVGVEGCEVFGVDEDGGGVGMQGRGGVVR